MSSLQEIQHLHDHYERFVRQIPTVACFVEVRIRPALEHQLRELKIHPATLAKLEPVVLDDYLRDPSATIEARIESLDVRREVGAKGAEGAAISYYFGRTRRTLTGSGRPNKEGRWYRPDENGAASWDVTLAEAIAAAGDAAESLLCIAKCFGISHSLAKLFNDLERAEARTKARTKDAYQGAIEAEWMFHRAIYWARFMSPTRIKYLKKAVDSLTQALASLPPGDTLDDEARVKLLMDAIPVRAKRHSLTAKVRKYGWFAAELYDLLVSLIPELRPRWRKELTGVDEEPAAASRADRVSEPERAFLDAIKIVRLRLTVTMIDAFEAERARPGQTGKLQDLAERMARRPGMASEEDAADFLEWATGVVVRRGAESLFHVPIAMDVIKLLRKAREEWADAVMAEVGPQLNLLLRLEKPERWGVFKERVVKESTGTCACTIKKQRCRCFLAKKDVKRFLEMVGDEVRTRRLEGGVA